MFTLYQDEIVYSVLGLNCLQCIRIAYIVPELFTVYQNRLQCTRIVYRVPELLTLYQNRLQCTRIVYSVPELFTVYQNCLHCTRDEIVYSVPEMKLFTVYQDLTVYSVPGCWINTCSISSPLLIDGLGSMADCHASP